MPYPCQDWELCQSWDVVFSVAPRPGTGAWHGGPALSRASLPGKERTSSEKGAELGQRERRRGPSGATVGRACTEHGIGRRELGTGVKGLGKLRRKFQLTVTAWLPNVCVGKWGAIWGHHKILTSLIAMAKWGRVSSAENKHPPPLDKTISLAHFRDTLRLSAKPVSSPRAWVGSYRAQTTLAACDFLSLCLMACHDTRGTPGLDRDKCHPGPLCKDSCPLWVPVSWL